MLILHLTNSPHLLKQQLQIRLHRYIYQVGAVDLPPVREEEEEAVGVKQWMITGGRRGVGWVKRTSSSAPGDSDPPDSGEGHHTTIPH